MKQIFFAGTVVCMMSLLSCGGNNDTAGTKSDTTVTSQFENNDSTYADSSNMSNSVTSGTMNNNATAMTLDAPATEFVQEAASGSMMEVQLGNMAAQKASSQRVKDFAAMMVTDHTAASNDLKSVAGANVPSMMLPKHQDHMNMFNSKSGAAFDKAYMNMMVTDHKKDIAAFQKASTSLTNDALKQFATRTLPTLQKHLDSAQAISKKM